MVKKRYMKKLLVFIALLNVSFGIFAFEFKPFYTGFKLEANQNSYKRVAAGAGLILFWEQQYYVALIFQGSLRWKYC